MNRNFTSILALILVCLVVRFLTGCSSSSSTTTPPPPSIAIKATSGSGQSATVGETFTNKLVATVTSNGTAASRVTVTFTPVAGSAGQSCTPSATLCCHRLRWHRIDLMHRKLDGRQLLCDGRGSGSHNNG